MKFLTRNIKANTLSGLAVLTLALGVLIAPAASNQAKASHVSGNITIQIGSGYGGYHRGYRRCGWRWYKVYTGYGTYRWVKRYRRCYVKRCSWRIHRHYNPYRGVYYHRHRVCYPTYYRTRY